MPATAWTPRGWVGHKEIMAKKLTKAQIEYVLFDRRSRRRAKTSRRIVTLDEVIQFLEDSASNHVAFYQYTSIDRLKRMLESKKLFLTQAKYLNDQLEYKTCSPERWGACYLSCFSFGSVENMGMWKMYGQEDAKAVRIMFPRKELLAAIRTARFGRIFTVIPGLDSDAPCQFTEFGGRVKNVSLHDVLYEYGRRYVDEQTGKIRRGTMLWNRKMAIDRACRELDDYRQHPEFATYVKDVIWAYENETRLVIECEQSVGLPARLAIDIQNALTGIEVQLGPNFKGGKKYATELLGAEVKIRESRYQVREANNSHVEEG